MYWIYLSEATDLHGPLSEVRYKFKKGNYFALFKLTRLVSFRLNRKSY